ncbi:MAG: pSer/pThr/pTyr-binding forkhead associated (FHA) protein [Oceanicoccus sp.]|jgi:pSer/pThr/pTyr-binding forkhead associated (FHA) protein
MLKLQFKDQPQRSIWLVGDKLRLGADDSNELVLEGLGIDDFHAEISINNDYLLLQNQVGSCYVNDLQVDNDYRLAAGDELRIGKQRLLLIDPKQAVESSSATVTASTNDKLWVLTSLQEKLQHQDFSLTGRNILGRSQECDFSVPYKLLSREHAAFCLENNELWLEDLGSANGSFVNGEQVTRVQLSDGDTISFAKLTFQVFAQSAAAKSAPNAIKQENVNKTMIRPVADIEAALAQAQQASLSSMSPPPEDDLAGDGLQSTQVSSEPVKRMVAIVVLVAVAAATIWWFV